MNDTEEYRDLAERLRATHSMEEGINIINLFIEENSLKKPNEDFIADIAYKALYDSNIDIDDILELLLQII